MIGQTGKYPAFFSLAEELAKNFRDGIYVDQVHYPIEHRADMFKLLKEHIIENIIKVRVSLEAFTAGAK